MGKTYKQADEVEEIASRLIEKHHRHLCNVHIEYWFVNKATVKGSKVILGTAQVISGIHASIANGAADREEGNFFAVIIGQDRWFGLTEAQKIALVDHELCHCDIEHDAKGQAVLTIKLHDLEEFGCIVERHGLWKSDIKDFAGFIQTALEM